MIVKGPPELPKPEIESRTRQEVQRKKGKAPASARQRFSQKSKPNKSRK